MRVNIDVIFIIYDIPIKGAVPGRGGGVWETKPPKKINQWTHFFKKVLMYAWKMRNVLKRMEN